MVFLTHLFSMNEKLQLYSDWSQDENGAHADTFNEQQLVIFKIFDIISPHFPLN